jgi:uncharacterized phiE125 gp8 family phage protein
MRVNTTITTDPSFEPVSTAQAKAHLRIFHSLDDTYIQASTGGSTSVITTARMMIENYCGIAIPNTTFTSVYDSFPQNTPVQGSSNEVYNGSGYEIALPRSPLVSVTSVQYVDTDGNTQTLSASTDYTVKSYNGIGRIQLLDGKTWPSLVSGGAGVVTVVYVAGHGSTATAIPIALKHAILMQCSTLYDYRSTLAPGQQYEVPHTITALIAQYKSGEYQ